MFSTVVIRCQKLHATRMQREFAYCSTSFTVIAAMAVVSAFASLEQITVAIEGLRDRRMAHERLNAFRAKALFDPQRSAGMAQSMQ